MSDSFIQNGNKYWCDDNGKLHRTDIDPKTGLTLPAAIDANGSKYWYLNGQWHRENGPAIERVDGSKEWYLNGQLHRIDGPAYEGSDGKTFQYWINDKHIPQLDNKRIYGRDNLEKLLVLL